MYSSVSQVSAVLAGLSVQQDHWKDNTSRKLESSSLSVNRTLLTALEAMATMAAREGLWITHSSTSKQIKESILRQATRIRVRTNRADIKIATLELQTLVSDSLAQGCFFFLNKHVSFVIVFNMIVTKNNFLASTIWEGD